MAFISGVKSAVKVFYQSLIPFFQNLSLPPNSKKLSQARHISKYAVPLYL